MSTTYKMMYCIEVVKRDHTFTPLISTLMSTVSADYKATLRSKIAVRADELYPGDSMDAIKERMTFTRKMYKMVMDEKNIDLF